LGGESGDLTVFLCHESQRAINCLSPLCPQRPRMYLYCVANDCRFVTTDHKSLLSCHQRSLLCCRPSLWQHFISIFVTNVLYCVSMCLLWFPQASFSRGVTTCGECPPVNQGHVGLITLKKNTHEMIGWMAQTHSHLNHLNCQ